MLDDCVSFCLWACFLIDEIAKVRRSDYIVRDHRHLADLDSFEKVHGRYCEVGTGLMAYIGRIQRGTRAPDGSKKSSRRLS
jgi:hypothetical protein